MASLAVTTQELLEHLGFYLGISRDPDTWAPETTADVNRVIRSGLRKFYTAHNWRHLEQDLQIVTAAPYATGTVTVVNGVVTLVGGTLPTTVVTNYLFSPESGGLYEIASRASGTSMTLFNTSLNVDAGSTFNLYKVHYDMPAKFGGWIDPITLENNTRCLQEFATIPSWELRSINNICSFRTGDPEGFAISQRHDADTSVPTWYLTVFPLPTSVKVLVGRYRIQPEDVLDLADLDEPIADPLFSECVLEAILASAEIYVNDTKGAHNDQFQELLAASIKKDANMRGTRGILPRDRFINDPLYYLRVAPITYET